MNTMDASSESMDTQHQKEDSIMNTETAKDDVIRDQYGNDNVKKFEDSMITEDCVKNEKKPNIQEIENVVKTTMEEVVNEKKEIETQEKESDAVENECQSEDETKEFNVDTLHLDESEDEVDKVIFSKNEIVDEIVPTLPETYFLSQNALIEPLGKIVCCVERSVVISGFHSGEFRVLKDNSILCLENRTIIGPLFEVFGKIQNPFYRIKFNSDAEYNKFTDSVGKEVYYVVDDSHFISVIDLKTDKGTDASNHDDEELSADHQEFSDDEEEQKFKQKKKFATINKKTFQNKKNDQNGLINNTIYQYTSVNNSGRNNKNFTDKKFSSAPNLFFFHQY